MYEMFELFAASMAHELNITPEQADRVVRWLDHEGALDYDLLKEVYCG